MLRIWSKVDQGNATPQWTTFCNRVPEIQVCGWDNELPTTILCSHFQSWNYFWETADRLHFPESLVQNGAVTHSCVSMWQLKAKVVKKWVVSLPPLTNWQLPAEDLQSGKAMPWKECGLQNQHVEESPPVSQQQQQWTVM